MFPPRLRPAILGGGGGEPPRVWADFTAPPLLGPLPPPKNRGDQGPKACLRTGQGFDPLPVFPRQPKTILGKKKGGGCLPPRFKISQLPPLGLKRGSGLDFRQTPLPPRGESRLGPPFSRTAPGWGGPSFFSPYPAPLGRDWAPAPGPFSPTFAKIGAGARAAPAFPAFFGNQKFNPRGREVFLPAFPAPCDGGPPACSSGKGGK